MDPKEQAFRDAAKAEGYSEKEILSHLAGLSKKSNEPTLPVSDTYEDFTKKEMPQARTAVQRMKESSSDTGSIVPYAIGAGGTAAAIAAGATAKKVYDTLSKKMESSAPTDTSKQTSFIQQEPTFDWQNFKPTDVTGTVSEQPVTQTGLTAKPTIADLQQKLGIAPNVVAPVAPVAPSAVEAVTPIADAAIAADPIATPAEKAQALVHAPETTPAEITPLAETTKSETVKGAVAPRAERGSLAGIAINPPVVEGQPGLREQYNIPKGINPVTGEKFMGPGGYNYLTGQVGPKRAPQAWEEQYGKRNVPAKQVIADYAATRYPPTAVTAEGKSGGAFEKPKYIPDYIKGAATIGGMANAGLNALGVAGLISDYKEAKKTGDWSNFGLNATGQAIANIVPKAALPAQLATYSKALGESPEELKALGKKLQDAQQAYKVGAGRGMQGVPPPAYNR